MVVSGLLLLPLLLLPLLLLLKDISQKLITKTTGSITYTNREGRPKHVCHCSNFGGRFTLLSARFAVQVGPTVTLRPTKDA